MIRITRLFPFLAGIDAALAFFAFLIGERRLCVYGIILAMLWIVLWETSHE